MQQKVRHTWHYNFLTNPGFLLAFGKSSSGGLFMAQATDERVEQLRVYQDYAQQE
jgi:hypothetical protein